MRILLDTNVYTALRRGHAEAAELVRASERLLFSVVVLGELFYGFRGGNRYAKNAQELHEFLQSPFVDLVPVTAVTADRFGRIAAALKSAGTPIPSNDVWIAAHAMETGAELASYDRHFALVPGLAWRPLAGPA